MSQAKHLEDAELRRASAWSRENLAPSVPPGSKLEAEALLRIDTARENEIARQGDTSPGKRRRRQLRYWRRRGVHVDV